MVYDILYWVGGGNKKMKQMRFGGSVNRKIKKASPYRLQKAVRNVKISNLELDQNLFRYAL